MKVLSAATTCLNQSVITDTEILNDITSSAPPWDSTTLTVLSQGHSSLGALGGCNGSSAQADLATGVLWRGGTELAMRQIYDTESKIANVEAMLRAPGDISGAKRVVYLTPQRPVAELYALFHCSLSLQTLDPALLEFKVPRIHTSGLTSEILLCDN